MSFDSKILSRVNAARLAREIKRETRLAAMRNEIYEKLPGIADMDTEIKTMAIEVARAAVVDGIGSADGIERLKVRAAKLRADIARLLIEHGYSSNAMDASYECAKCRDSGYCDKQPCACLINEYAEAQLDALAETLPVRKQNFNTYSDKVFSAATDPKWGVSRREYMKAAYVKCRKFAESDAASLLISGPAGTGKTYLASCIAEAVSRKGLSVIYGTASDIFALYERAKFSNDWEVQRETAAEIERLRHCDLLIIDDLGAEFKVPFIPTAFMSLLDGRLRREKRMLICTALDMADELPSRYPPQIVSRLKGDFDQLPLFGSDLRQEQ